MTVTADYREKIDLIKEKVLDTLTITELESEIDKAFPIDTDNVFASLNEEEKELILIYDYKNEEIHYRNRYIGDGDPIYIMESYTLTAKIKYDDLYKLITNKKTIKDVSIEVEINDVDDD